MITSPLLFIEIKQAIFSNLNWDQGSEYNL